MYADLQIALTATASSWYRCAVNTKPIILLDVDGVLANFAGAVQQLFEDVGRQISIDRHDFTDALRANNTDHSHYVRRSSDPGFCYGISSFSGSVPFVEALRKIGDVVAVTAPLKHSRTWSFERRQWLVDHFQFDYDDIIFAKRKDLVVGDFLVEDNYDNLASWHRRWRGAHNDGFIRNLLVGHRYNSEHQPDEQGDFFARFEIGNYDSIVAHIKAAICDGAEPISGRNFH